MVTHQPERRQPEAEVPGRLEAASNQPPVTGDQQPEASDPEAETYLFRREGEYWTIRYGSAQLHLRDSKGLQYLAELLRRPGERIAVQTLLAVCDSSGSHTPRPSDAQHGDAGVERARVAVTKRIKAAVHKITRHDAALGYHLATAVKTGFQCVYLPDPQRPRRWVG